MTTSALRAVQARVRRERAEWALRLPNKAVLDRAERLAERLPVRVLDAIHLASALLFNDEAAVLTPFFTADERQRHAAIALGLDVHFVE